jgi:secretion/DNA translocation related TadE-like protein
VAGEQGSAAVLGTALVGVLGVVTVMVSVVAGAVTDQRRLEAAVDLGALAGASAAQRGEDACAAAGSVTGRNGGDVTACSVSDDIVTLRAGRVTREVLGMRFTLAATARAGPASALPGATGAITGREREAPKGDKGRSGEFQRRSGVRG